MWSNNTKRWHAIFVTTGHEELIKKTLEKYLDNIHFMVPKREVRERKAGKWYKVKRNLFPGYILLNGMITTETYYQMKKIPMMTKLLKSEDGPLEIKEKEIELINKLIGNTDGNIGISTAYKENEKIKIISGPLTGLEGHIQSIDKRQGRAKVQISFLNQTKTVHLGIDIIDKTNAS